VVDPALQLAHKPTIVVVGELLPAGLVAPGQCQPRLLVARRTGEQGGDELAHQEALLGVRPQEQADVRRLGDAGELVHGDWGEPSAICALGFRFGATRGLL